MGNLGKEKPSARQQKIIDALAGGKRMTVTEMMNATQETRGTVMGLMTRLNEKGLITVDPHTRSDYVMWLK